jgi:hypothetical protein
MRSVLLLITALTLLAIATGPARADDPLAEKVRHAIDGGRKYLLGLQRDNGSWEVTAPSLLYPGGATSLTLLALLESGVPANDPQIVKGLQYLRTLGLPGGPDSRTYVAALQTMVFAKTDQAVDRERIQKNVDWLLTARMPDGWTYGRNRGGADNSNTHYALMGLAAGIAAGARVDAKALAAIRDFYLRTQTGGGWQYRPRHDRATLTMTTAGLCGLLLTERSLGAGEKLRDDGSAERCGEYEGREAVNKALRWLGEHFPAEIKPKDATRLFTIQLFQPFYFLHDIQSAGRLTGRRFFGRRDWYEIGCRYLLATQKANGSWAGEGDIPRRVDSPPVVETSFALLFLAGGRTPVLIVKLAYGRRDYDGWNNKPGDARHLVEFASRELFKRRPLAWQIFDVRGIDADTKEAIRGLAGALREAPVVYFNGHDSAPSGKEERLLKEYLASGGFILAESCCGDQRFDKDFRALLKRLFPDTELKPLRAGHPLWKASGKFALAPSDWPLLGIDSQGRTVVIYSPKPLAGYWQAGQSDKGRGQLAFRVGASAIAYATGLKAPVPRGASAK